MRFEIRPRHLIVILFLFLIGFFVVGIISGFSKDRHIKKEIARLQAEESRLKSENLESIEFLKKIKSREFIEKEAKDKLGLTKSGEHAVVFSSTTEIIPLSNLISGTAGLTNPRLWWYYFFAPER